MVLRVKPTPTRLPTNSLYTPMDNTPLHSISSVCHPWGIWLLYGLIISSLTYTAYIIPLCQCALTVLTSLLRDNFVKL